MKVTYDPVVDALKITLSNVPIAESDEQSPGVILDYDQWGNVVGLEILLREFRLRGDRGRIFPEFLDHLELNLREFAFTR